MSTNDNRYPKVIRVQNVNVIEQKGHKIYFFALAALELLTLGRVEHYGQDEHGVNRALNQQHALEIAEAMVNPALLWLEPFLGDMRGSWVYDPERHELHIGDDAFFSIDDGQHRFHAVGLLNAAEQSRLTFTVTGTIGLSRSERLQLFRMQAQRRAIDARLDLAQRHELGEWERPLHAEAYRIVLALQNDDDSPIKGQIILSEQSRMAYKGRNRPVGINGKGLFNSVVQMINSRSPLHGLSPEKRLEVIKNMLRAAAEVWAKPWESETHMLKTARGVNSVLLLLVQSPSFGRAIGTDFSFDTLKTGLAYGSTFDWTAAKRRHDAVAKLVEALDNSIQRGQTKATKAAA